MSIEFVNRICPNCKNPNYMMYIGDVAKLYKYKCMKCFRYFNDDDFEKEPMNTKVDMVEVVRCKDCRYCTIAADKKWRQDFGKSIYECDHNGLCNVEPDWFCADGERRTNDA